MIFSERSIALIMAGKKTQTTRLKEPRVKVGGIYSIKRNWFRKENFGRIRVISKEQTTLKRFSASDLKREGYKNLATFKEALEKINRTKISLNRIVWKVVFEYI